MLPAVFVTAARLIDGRGGHPAEPGRILIEGDRIRAVGSDVEMPPHATRHDFPDGTILPGLIDCHVHLADAGAADPQESARDDDAIRVLRLAAETAHALGRRIAAHAQGIEGIRNAVAAGVDTIEHGTYLHEDPSVAAQMAERGIALVPTLKASALLGNPPGPGIPPEIVE